VYGTGEQSRDFTYVGDAAAATVAAMEEGHAGTTYNVGGGSETTLREVIALIERLAGKRVDVNYEPTAVGDVRRTAADTTRLRSDLGWHPQTSLAEGLAAQIDAARAATRIAP
jgi:nucleoside-diphosphate-sugar epimerase